MLRKKATILLTSFIFISNPVFGQFAVNLEGRYDIASIKKYPPENQDTAAFQMTGLEGLLLLQFIPLDHDLITPYIGLGLGMIPSYNGKSADIPDAFDNTGTKISTKITLRNIPYITLELGPEFIFQHVRWQIFLGYDYGLGGKLSRSFSESDPSVYTQPPADQTALKRFNRFRVGTRVYFIATSHFDFGVLGNYVFNGNFKDDGKVGNGYGTSVTSYNFTEMSFGIALRVRFP